MSIKDLLKNITNEDLFNFFLYNSYKFSNAYDFLLHETFLSYTDYPENKEKNRDEFFEKYKI